MCVPALVFRITSILLVGRAYLTQIHVWTNYLSDIRCETDSELPVDVVLGFSKYVLQTPSIGVHHKHTDIRSLRADTDERIDVLVIDIEQLYHGKHGKHQDRHRHCLDVI